MESIVIKAVRARYRELITQARQAAIVGGLHYATVAFPIGQTRVSLTYAAATDLFESATVKYPGGGEECIFLAPIEE